MSQSIDSQGWDRFKNVIRGIYMTKGHKLEGAEGVIKIMESQHGFKKTKAQYEKQLKIWGFTKYRSKRDWEIMNRKIQLRKRTGKDSDVYRNGQLMPADKLQKETSRQGYMTTVEQARLAFGEIAMIPPPQTPPGFDIRTPLAQPFFRLAFENLPIFQFKEFAQRVYAGSITPFDTSTTALTKIFQSPDRKNDSYIPPIMDSLLPMSAFLEEPLAAGLAMQRVEDVGQAELLNLATFMASNNFPGDTNSEKLREWLKTHSTASVVEALSYMKVPTAEALLENLFRFAIEDEDVSTVKYLLHVGVNPNGHKCQLHDYTPLQYAVVRGNNEMALELIEAGSIIDQSNTGSKSSALVLAIIKNCNPVPWRFTHDEVAECKDSDTERYEAEDSGYFVDDHTATPTREASNRLFRLVSSLINAGAAVNISKSFVKPPPLGEKCKYFFTPLSAAFFTPLSAASAYHEKDIVDLLIQNGADATFPTDESGACSPLHECLYMQSDIGRDLQCGFLRPRGFRLDFSRDSKGPNTIADVARSLVKAGANVHEEINCRSIYKLRDDYSGPESYTIFDLGVLTGSMEVVNILMSAGAQITASSVEYAVEFESLDILNRLLGAGASVPTNLTIINEYPQALATKIQNIWIKELALLKAIHYGHVSIIEYLFRDGTFSCRSILYLSTEITRAIENCCSGGHVGALRLILQNSLKRQFSLSPYFGNSLHLAIANGRDEVTDTLLSAGADVNAMGDKGRTKLLLATIMRKNNKLFERLMGTSVILNPIASSSTYCSKVHAVSGDILIAAIQWGDSVVVSYLLERGADIEAFGATHEQDNDCCKCIRPLTAALMTKNLDLVHDLLRRGVKINNHLDCALASKARVPQGSDVRMTPLAAAIQTSDSEMVDLIIHGGGNPFDFKAIVETMHNHQLRGVLLNAMHSSDQPTSITYYDGAFAGAIEIFDEEMIRTIIYSPLWDITADMTLLFALDCILTPNPRYLDTRARRGSLVKTILEASTKTDMSILSSKCFSPVQSAVRKEYHEAAKTLLEYGSNPNSVSIGGCVYINHDYRTPLQIAVNHQDMEMIKILFQYKADANGTAIDEYEADNDEEKAYYPPRTPLQEASMGGSKVIVELLLEQGADVNFPPVMGNGATALQYAAMYGFLGIAHLLLEHEADVNAPPAKSDGRTALEGAAEHGRLDMVQFLLNVGANIFGDGQAQYENAVRRATGNGHHAIRRMLEKHRADRE
ncbi:hypothetical protein ACLOAV_009759 [Pseudogymnoascus australis]